MGQKKKDSDKGSQNSESAKNAKNQQSDDEEPNFSDPEGYVDISDDELLADILQDKPREIDGVDSIIAVDGLPQVEPERFQKLQNVVIKIFSKFGTIINTHYPLQENGFNKRYFFCEYSNPESAMQAKANHQQRLDKQHILFVCSFTDFKRFEDIPDKWEPPQPKPYEEQKDIYNFLLEPDAYDQFCIICSRENTVQIWQNTLPELTKLEERPGWTDLYVQWSPLGTYLATLHTKGVALWGGPEFTRIMKFTHAGVQFVEFSPCEKYLVTYAPQTDQVNRKLVIWDIRMGVEKRSFNMSGPCVWPIFRWSKDDSYFARITSKLSIFETPSFGLLDKESLKVENIKDFSWSPTDNIIAYWVCPNDQNEPSRVVLMDVPSKVEIRTNTQFNVADCKLHWQKSGDHLCVKLDRYGKVKKEKDECKYTGMYYNFEIFHMREKNVPVDIIEIKEPIHAFAWEPTGIKFAIIHGEAPNISVSFYGVKTKIELLKTFEKTACNTLFWSPAGQFIVLADLRTNGNLEFVDTNDFAIMNAPEHYSVSDVEWDPTGRYVVTAVSNWKAKVDAGYWIWTFQGKILKRCNVDDFCQLLWRPRPPSLLDAEKQKQIKKNLKKYSAQFESKDRLRQTKASKELIEKRSSLMKKFDEFRERAMEQWAAQKARRLQMRNNIDTDELEVETDEEEEVEFLVKEETTIID